jgi:hypothetical protein
MTKRPKLSLDASEESVKKRPDGFRAPPSPTTRPGLTLRQEARADTNAPPATNTERGPQALKQSSTWLNPGTVVKTLLVVGAAALSIYFLKRRLF